MKVVYYRNAKAFMNDTGNMLMEEETRNNLMITNAVKGSEEDHPDWFFASVKDECGHMLAAIMRTPPYNALLSAPGGAVGEGVLEFFAREICVNGVRFPGIMAQEGLAECFARAYAKIAGDEAKLKETLNLMELEGIYFTGNAPGKIRPLVENDVFFDPYWAKAFSQECNLIQYDIEVLAQRTIEKAKAGSHYVWEDGGVPVSVAGVNRSTKNSASISGVYTPPYFRGKGYATSCVASIAGKLLAKGYKTVSLYADAANPVSNGIYRKVGFRDLCVFKSFEFVANG